MIHPDNCECPTYGCVLRRKGIMLSATASQTMRVRRPWRDKVNCSWEAGVAGEHRPGGTFMPYIGERTGRKIRMKEAAERRGEISEIRHRRMQSAHKE
jgi:hypothetical protein